MQILCQRAPFVNRLPALRPSYIMTAKICSGGAGLALELTKLTHRVGEMGRVMARREADFETRAARAREILRVNATVKPSGESTGSKSRADFVS